MNRKTFALLYILLSSLANIIFTLFVVAVFMAVALVIAKFGIHAKAESYGTILFSSFTVGLVVSFVLYSKISMKVIKKYKFDERFGSSPKKKNSTVQKVEEKKTVLPSSVLEDKEDSKWAEE